MSKESDKEAKAAYHIKQKRNVAPEFNAYTRTGQRWLDFGSDNLYPQGTVKLLNSATHNAIINTKAAMAYGTGPVFDPADEQLRAALDAACGGDCEPFLRRVLRDIVVHNGFAIRVRYSADFIGIAQLEYVDFKTVRVESPTNQADLVPKMCFLSPDWAQITPNTYSSGGASASDEPLFNPKSRHVHPANKTGEPTQILYGIVPSDLTDFYPAPDYLGVINWALTEIEIGNYHYKNVSNCFKPDMIITMPDTMAEPEKEDFVRKLTEQYSGTDNAGGMIVLFAPTTQSATGSEGILYPQITAMPNSANADMWLITLDHAIQQIITGHRLTSPAIAGLSGAGGLGGNASEIATAFDYFYNTVVKDYARRMNDLMWPVLSFMGFNKPIKFGSPIAFTPTDVVDVLETPNPLM